jgi:hypothetical protein
MAGRSISGMKSSRLPRPNFCRECILLDSDVAGAVCQHLENALVHPACDKETQIQNMNFLQEYLAVLKKLCAASLYSAHQQITWDAAGIKLLQMYQQLLEEVIKPAIL